MSPRGALLRCGLLSAGRARERISSASRLLPPVTRCGLLASTSTGPAGAASCCDQAGRGGFPGCGGAGAGGGGGFVDGGFGEFGDEWLSGGEAEPDAAADGGDRDDLGGQVVAGRAGRAWAGRLDDDLPGVDADGDGTDGGLGARELAAAVEVDDR